MTSHHFTDPPPAEHGPHPAICLALGFGVIVAGAIIVHLLFNVVV